MMKWDEIVRRLQARGMTQKEIAMHLGVTQGWVSAVALKRISAVTYDHGMKLIALDAQKTPKEPVHG